MKLIYALHGQSNWITVSDTERNQTVLIEMTKERSQ